jgi:glycosyltransferase involved in cell wall biosynthesis
MAYDPAKREATREAHGWENKYVIGNVGRLHFQKNQRFLIRVFAEYQKLDADSLLVIVGQGEDREKLENLCRELGIEERVRFTGVQKDIQGMLSAFDLFLFPSLFEGLAIAALEAQANGVPVLASEHVIPDAIRLNGNCRTLSLNCPASEWALQVESMKATETRADRDAVESAFRKSGYDISTEARKLERLLTQ